MKPNRTDHEPENEHVYEITPLQGDPFDQLLFVAWSLNEAGNPLASEVRRNNREAFYDILVQCIEHLRKQAIERGLV